MAQKATLADASREAGVGISTVSRALGDHPDVSASTRERVRDAARRLGYRPSAAARALRSGGYRAISVIVPDAGWGWWEPVIHSAFEAALAAGYQLLVHPIAGTPGGLAAVVEGLADVPTDGVVVVSVPDQAAVRDACESISLPAVAIDDSARSRFLPTISPRNRHGARLVTDHLIRTGRRRIAILTYDSTGGIADWGEGLFAEERLRGYEEALSAAGIEFDPRLVLTCPRDYDATAAGCTAVESALDEGVEFDALFCIADLMAPPVLRSLRRRDIGVPQEVAVAGFDDENIARIVDPPLTTVRQPYEEMGRLAVELLLRRIGQEAVSDERYELDVRLVVRESTAIA